MITKTTKNEVKMHIKSRQQLAEKPTSMKKVFKLEINHGI